MEVGANLGEISVPNPPGGGIDEIIAAVPGVLGARVAAVAFPLDCLLPWAPLVLFLLDPNLGGLLFLSTVRALELAVNLGDDVGVDSDPERFMSEAGVTGSREDFDVLDPVAVAPGIADVAVDIVEAIAGAAPLSGPELTAVTVTALAAITTGAGAKRKEVAVAALEVRIGALEGTWLVWVGCCCCCP